MKRASITHTLGVYTVQDIVKYSLYISTAHNDVINVLCKHLFIKIIHERKFDLRNMKIMIPGTWIDLH